MSKQTEYTWDSYVEEAQIEPFRLRISADETIEVQPPTSNAIVRIHQGMRVGDLELIIAHLTGDQWPRFRELFDDPVASHKVLPKLVEDMMDHFDIYEDVTLVGPGGGKVKRRRPREIQAMIEQGYRPVGEAPASNG